MCATIAKTIDRSGDHFTNKVLGSFVSFKVASEDSSLSKLAKPVGSLSLESIG